MDLIIFFILTFIIFYLIPSIPVCGAITGMLAAMNALHFKERSSRIRVLLYTAMFVMYIAGFCFVIFHDEQYLTKYMTISVFPFVFAIMKPYGKTTLLGDVALYVSLFSVYIAGAFAIVYTDNPDLFRYLGLGVIPIVLAMSRLFIGDNELPEPEELIETLFFDEDGDRSKKEEKK